MEHHYVRPLPRLFTTHLDLNVDHFACTSLFILSTLNIHLDPTESLDEQREKTK